MEFLNKITLKRVPFSYHWIFRKAMGKDFISVLDLGCGDGSFISNVLKGERKKVVGVDIHKESLEKAKKLKFYKELIRANVLKLPSRLRRRKFDVVISSQVLEHLSKKEGVKFLNEMERLAKKRIVVSTPSGFIEYTPIEKKEENNPYQRHRSGWKISELKNLGFTVRGQGAKFIYGKGGLARKTPVYFLPFWSFVAYFLAPVVYLYPRLGLISIAKKDKYV